MTEAYRHYNKVGQPMSKSYPMTVVAITLQQRLQQRYVHDRRGTTFENPAIFPNIQLQKRKWNGRTECMQEKVWTIWSPQNLFSSNKFPLFKGQMQHSLFLHAHPLSPRNRMPKTDSKSEQSDNKECMIMGHSNWTITVYKTYFSQVSFHIL